MDLPSAAIYDAFTDEVWDELGPLDPNWFDVLTAEAFTNDGSEDQDDLCANQEGNFKTPLDKTAVESQLLSTPKVFRHGRAVSPETEDDQSFTAEHEKETLPWMTTSPYLFRMSKERMPNAKSHGVLPTEDSLYLLHTPQKSPQTVFAKRITESLGAQMNLDISWTSSLNTPPAVPSTLILTRKEEEPCPLSLSSDKNVVIVRKLFPSLSNASRVEAVSPKTNACTVQEDGVSLEAAQYPELNESLQTSLNQSDSVWKQKLPDAIEDEEVRSTVASVLDGAENALSVFFTNSSSALRKVKTERIKRRQIIPTKDDGSGSMDLQNSSASNEQKTADQEPGRVPLSPHVKKTANTETVGSTQWSPLSLSEIPHINVDTSCHDDVTGKLSDNILDEQSLSYISSGPGKLVKQPLKMTDSGIIKKRRLFVYTVKSSKLPQQGQEIHSENSASSPGIHITGQELNTVQIRNAPNEAKRCSNNKNISEEKNLIQKCENITEENLPPTAQAKFHDLDMSQLCVAFAQDFSQMSDPVKRSSVTEDAVSNGFSPSTCLSALKRARQKTRQERLHCDCEDVSNNGLMSAINQNVSISEGTVSDSGFQSAVTEISHMTVSLSVLPCSEKDGQQKTDFQTQINKMCHFPPKNTGNEQVNVSDSSQKAQMCAELPATVTECKTLGSDGESKLNSSKQLCTSAGGDGGRINSLSSERTVSLPSALASGFKTASNKALHISSASLEKAKYLFDETGDERTSTDQPAVCSSNIKKEFSTSYDSKKDSKCNSNNPPLNGKLEDIGCHLTASQKADVRELCTLLEEADSQFEFTQFKTTNLHQQCQDNGISSQKADKELDPDFLNGIDFDDSFSSDAEKSLPVTMTFDKYQTSDVTFKPSDSLSDVMSKEKSSTGDTDFISEGSESMMSFNVAGHDETNKADSKSSSLLCEGFKTAQGSMLKVSKKYLSKARALFADLEENSVIDNKLIDVPLRKSEQRCGVVLSTGQTELKLTSNDKHCAVTSRHVTGIRDDPAPNSLEFSKMSTTTSQRGFKMASGKGICISAKAMHEAKTLFKDCDLVDPKDGSLLKHISGSDKNTFSKSKNVQGVKESISEEPRRNKGSRNENVTDERGGDHAETPHNDAMAGSNHSPVLRNSNSLHGNSSSPAEPLCIPICPASGNTYSSAVRDWNNGNVFCTASGKKLSVSAAAIEKAKSLLNEVDICEDTNKQPKPKENLFKTGNLRNHIQRLPPQDNGFKTAGGKGVIISLTALKNAKSLLHECDKPDNKSSMNQTHPRLTVNGPLPRNRGFLAASGKPVAISAQAFQKAKALFDDISFPSQIPAASDTTDAKPDRGLPNTENIQKSFKTAGGAKVYLCDDGGTSTNSLQRADGCIKQLDVLDSSDNISEKPPPAASGSAGEKRLTTTEKPQIKHFLQTAKGCTESENNCVGPVVTCKRLQHHNDVEMINPSFSTDAPSVHRQSSLPQSTGSGFCTASGKKVSISDEAMTKAKVLLNENPAFEERSTKENALPQHNSGFKTASGKGVLISPAALNKAKCLLNECDESENKSSMNQTHPKPIVSALPPKTSGFQTAAGKRVTVSVSALKKAQSFLSEFNDIGDETGAKQTYSKPPVNNPPPRNNGFLSASGKPVALSAEALQKAKALFEDMSYTAETAAASDAKTREEKLPSHTEKIQCGFTTAGGAKVHVPKKNLEKVKHLWKDFFDGECPHSDSHALSAKDSNKPDPSTVNYLEETSRLLSAGEKDGPPKGIHPLEDESYRALHEIDCANKVPQDPSISNTDKCKRPANMEDCEINQTSSSEARNVLKAKHSSIVNIQSSVCNGCTETQQKFLAQEALDCTMALLEDEGRTGQSLTVNLENISLQNDPKASLTSVGAKKGTGKRAVEDSDPTGQPPLKRQLLEEFDRTVNKPNRSALHPEKSCPNGVMNDRRVFKYSVSLHPNITRTPSSVKYPVETKLQNPATQSVAQPSTSANSRAAHVKVSAFVPPFLNNTRTQTQKNNVHKDNRRTSSVFVPPFKKQIPVVRDSSFKPHKGEEQHNHVTVTPSDSNTCVVFANKTQSIMGVADNTSKEDIHTQGLPDSTKANPAKCQHLGSCGTETSVEKASNVRDISSRSQEILQNIELARDMQDMRIRKKKRQTIRPLPGSLFLTKTSSVSRITLTAAVNGKPPAKYTQNQLYEYGVHQHVSEITSEAAEAFRFNLLQFLKREAFIDGGGVQLADGGWLIPSSDGTAGKEEFYRALCDTPGVDPKLVSEEWVYNHYRWIVWKLASMERSYPVTMGSVCLTPEQVLLQLKYRYDVEVDHSRRPALRKIMEKDDTAAKTLVLCVCGVISSGHSPNKQSRTEPRTPQGVSTKTENSSAVVWLTDGWYAIKAQLDDPLTAMLHKGRLGVGGKLITHGAQLVGSQDACSPLEAPESLMLKICANSSRPVRWDTKLGFHRDPRPFLLPISSLYSNGGPVGCVNIVILRCYPIQWMERKPDGGVVFRSERAEEKEARRYNSHKQKAMETVFAKIQAEFENEETGNMKPQRRRRTASRQDVAKLQDGEELHEAVGDDLEAHLSETQLETLRSYRRSLMEKRQAELQDRYRRALEAAEDSEGSCPKRDVSPVWRLSITDSMDPTGSSGVCSVYQLNIWQPSSDLQSILKEGCRFKVYNLTTSDGKKRGVQLTATKKTQFQDIQASQGWLSARFQPRVSASFVDLQNPDFQSLCGEVDLTGFIISVIDEQGSSPAFYLADERMNFVKIRCFSSFAQSGVEDIVKPRVLLALSNLQLRGQSMCPTPVVYAGDLTIFSTNPKEVHLQKSLSHRRDCVQAQGNFFVTAEEKLSHMVRADGFSAISSPALQPTTPASTAERRQDAKTSVTSQQPNRSIGAFTPVSRNPAAPNSSTEKDPKSLKRRRALDYLSRIPSPPPLPDLNSGTTPCVKKKFNPPRRSGTPSTLKIVQTPPPKPPVFPVEDGWVNDEELAMIDTQKLCAGDLL